jgi:hypothetical protein
VSCNLTDDAPRGSRAQGHVECGGARRATATDNPQAKPLKGNLTMSDFLTREQIADEMGPLVCSRLDDDEVVTQQWLEERILDLYPYENDPRRICDLIADRFEQIKIVRDGLWVLASPDKMAEGELDAMIAYLEAKAAGCDDAVEGAEYRDCAEHWRGVKAERINDDIACVVSDDQDEWLKRIQPPGSTFMCFKKGVCPKCDGWTYLLFKETAIYEAALHIASEADIPAFIVVGRAGEAEGGQMLYPREQRMTVDELRDELIKIRSDHVCAQELH